MKIKLKRIYDLEKYISNIYYFFKKYQYEQDTNSYDFYRNLCEIDSHNGITNFIDYVEIFLNNFHIDERDENNFISELLTLSNDYIDLQNWKK